MVPCSFAESSAVSFQLTSFSDFEIDWDLTFVNFCFITTIELMFLCGFPEFNVVSFQLISFSDFETDWDSGEAAEREGGGDQRLHGQAQRPSKTNR